MHARAPALLLVLLLAVAGCGDRGADASVYVGEVAAVQRAVRTEAVAVAPQLEEATSRRGVARGLRALADVVDQNAQALGRVEPPEEVAADHRSYRELMGRFARQLRGLADRVEEADAKALPGIRRDVRRISAEVGAREQRLIGRINAELSG